jgi:hypothetical protein
MTLSYAPKGYLITANFSFEKICFLLTNVQPKPVLFWFRPDTVTQTQIGQYSADTVTDTETTFQRKNLVTNSMG